MGLNENKEVIAKISDKKKREYLIRLLENYLKLCISLMEYLKMFANTRKAKLVCAKSIKNGELAITHIRQIKHIEVLEYLYATFVGNNVLAYSLGGKIVLSPKLKEFDTDEGVKELVEIMKDNYNKQVAKEKELQEKIDAVNKAKAEGKKVEMVYDKDTKTTKPMIVEDGESN